MVSEHSQAQGPGCLSVQAAVTEYHRLCGFNNKHLLLTVLEAGKCKIKALADLFLVKAPFMVDGCFL